MRLLIFIFLLSAGAVRSQQAAEVVMTDEMEEVIRKSAMYYRESDERNGYRLQIMYSSVRDEVYKEKAALYKEFPDLPSYVDYEQPHFKLKLGDFSDRLEATYYLQQVISNRPGAFIVKDRVKSK